MHAGTNAGPLDISPDGRLLVYSITGNTKDDLWLPPLQGQRIPTTYLDGPSEERHAQFSPTASGSRTHPTSPVKRRLCRRPATSGRSRRTEGSRPGWRPDGKGALLPLGRRELMAVAVKLGAGTLKVGGPERCLICPWHWPQLSVPLRSPVGREKFLASVLTDGSMSPVTIWMNWMADTGK